MRSTSPPGSGSAGGARLTCLKTAALKKAALAVTAGMLCSTLAAAPAAWQIWRSKSTGVSVCAQVSPGEGWERTGGPYRDAHCSKAGLPGR